MKSARVAARPNVPPYGMPMIPMDNDDGVSFKGFVSLLFLHYYVYWTVAAPAFRYLNTKEITRKTGELI